MDDVHQSETNDSRENLQIIVEKNLSNSRLSELGIKSWPKWACCPGKYQLRYEAEETCYFVKGKVRAYSSKTDYVEFGAGDLVIIPKGVTCTWDVLLSVDKYYKFDSSSSSS